MSNWLVECRNCGEEFEKYQWNQKNCYDCLEKLDPRFKGRPKKPCLWCGEEFQPRVIRQVHCCEEHGEMTRQHNYYLREYGVSREEINKMVEDSGGRCNICGSIGFVMDKSKHSAKLVVDHDHQTDRVRGLLCHNCNRGLGLFQDDRRILENSIEYLQEDVWNNLERGYNMSQSCRDKGISEEPFEEDLE